MSRRKRALGMGASVAAIGLIVVAAIAIAHDSAAPELEADPAAGPERISFQEQENFQAGVPDDPYIEFCPTPEQVEAFAERSGGLDLKPNPPDGIGCSRTGAWLPPDPPNPDDPVDRLSEEKECKHLKDELSGVTPLPKGDDPRHLDGRRADGSEVGIIVQGPAKNFEDVDIQDFADGLDCG